jgi:hypothetical protein
VPMITTENFSTRGYYDAGAVTQTSAQIFVAMAALTTVLSDMLKTFYTMKGMARLHKVPPIDIYNLVAQFDERLDAYKQQYLMPLHVVDMFLDPTGRYPLELLTFFKHSADDLCDPNRNRVSCLLYIRGNSLSCSAPECRPQ